MFISTMKYLFALLLAIGVAGAPTLSTVSSNSCMSDCTANSINDIAKFVINNSNLLPSLIQKIQEARLNVDESGSHLGSGPNQGGSGLGNLFVPASGISGNLGNFGNGPSNGASGSSGNSSGSSVTSGSSPSSGSGSDSPISTLSITSALSGLGGASPLSTVLNKIKTLGVGSLDGLVSKLPSSALNQIVDPSSIVKQLSGTNGGQVPASSVVSFIIGQLPSSTIGDIQKQDGNGLASQSGNVVALAAEVVLWPVSSRN
ncbi:cell wall protein IFF6-like [Contarinia nasturtii]|uniref:cell wall protein IFF6-like n=1 Tax=Contarinia nasturtii TaxID=265458 RepID=UPI0012D4716F|nr:cell wall protein IFF6-like [Contarinia nasturtii]